MLQQRQLMNAVLHSLLKFQFIACVMHVDNHNHTFHLHVHTSHIRSTLQRTSFHVLNSVRTHDVLPLTTFAGFACLRVVFSNPCCAVRFLDHLLRTSSTYQQYPIYIRTIYIYHQGADLLPSFCISVLWYLCMLHTASPIVLRVIRAP